MHTRCEYDERPGGLVPVAGCPDYRPRGNATSGKYEQKVNGEWVIRDCNLAVAGLVWNQTACRCTWGADGEVDPLDFERELLLCPLVHLTA